MRRKEGWTILLREQKRVNKKKMAKTKTIIALLSLLLLLLLTLQLNFIVLKNEKERKKNTDWLVVCCYSLKSFTADFLLF